MTEQEWLTSEDPRGMLEFAIGHNANLAEGIGGGSRINLSDRKLRLFCCICNETVLYSYKPIYDYGEEGSLINAPLELARMWAGDVWTRVVGLAPIKELARRAALLREIIGNPFSKPVEEEELLEWQMYMASPGTGPAGIAYHIYCQF